MKEVDFLEKYYQELYQKLLIHPETYHWIYSLPQELEKVKVQWLNIPKAKSLLKHLNNIQELPLVEQPKVEMKKIEVNDDLNNPLYSVAIEQLKDLLNHELFTQADFFSVDGQVGCNESKIIQGRLNFLAHEMKPWRKGPYKLYNLEIDAEWRSDLKWHLFKDKVNLKDKTIFDIGSSNGYHLWCYQEAGAKFIIGVEPYWLFCLQYLLIRQFVKQNIKKDNLILIPTGVEAIPVNSNFDFVMSMGVLYHRKDPIQHLKDLRIQLKANNLPLKESAVVLETIIQNSPDKVTCYPLDTYAKMPNVYSIPSLTQLEDWLTISGFKEFEVISYRAATLIEQRVTSWIDDESFSACLDPNDPSKTVEGLAAPYRVIILAK